MDKLRVLEMGWKLMEKQKVKQKELQIYRMLGQLTDRMLGWKLRMFQLGWKLRV